MKHDDAIRDTRAQAAAHRTLTVHTQSSDDLQGDGRLRMRATEQSARLLSLAESLLQTPGAVSEPPGDARPQRPDAAGFWSRILVVEDDDAARAAIARGLAPEYEVVVASTGMEGLKAASDRPFDAIVADMAMPEMDGLAMLARIRQIDAAAAVPVVFLTAKTAPERLAAGVFARGTSYLAKPVDLDLLDQELRRVLAGHGE